MLKAICNPLVFNHAMIEDMSKARKNDIYHLGALAGEAQFLLFFD